LFGGSTILQSSNLLASTTMRARDHGGAGSHDISVASGRASRRTEVARDPSDKPIEPPALVAGFDTVTEEPGGKTMLDNAGSASAAVTQPRRSPGSDANSAPPDTSPAKAWDDALKQAKANSPQQSVTVKPGDTMTGIARRHNDPLASVEQANPRISNPNERDRGGTRTR
jgi:hypothetical protein